MPLTRASVAHSKDGLEKDPHIDTSTRMVERVGEGDAIISNCAGAESKTEGFAGAPTKRRTGSGAEIGTTYFMDQPFVVNIYPNRQQLL